MESHGRKFPRIRKPTAAVRLQEEDTTKEKKNHQRKFPRLRHKSTTKSGHAKMKEDDAMEPTNGKPMGRIRGLLHHKKKTNKKKQSPSKEKQSPTQQQMPSKTESQKPLLLDPYEQQDDDSHQDEKVTTETAPTSNAFDTDRNVEWEFEEAARSRSATPRSSPVDEILVRMKRQPEKTPVKQELFKPQSQAPPQDQGTPSPEQHHLELAATSPRSNPFDTERNVELEFDQAAKSKSATPRSSPVEDIVVPIQQPEQEVAKPQSQKALLQEHHGDSSTTSQQQQQETVPTAPALSNPFDTERNVELEFDQAAKSRNTTPRGSPHSSTPPPTVSPLHHDETIYMVPTLQHAKMPDSVRDFYHEVFEISRAETDSSLFDDLEQHEIHALTSDLERSPSTSQLRQDSHGNSIHTHNDNDGSSDSHYELNDSNETLISEDEEALIQDIQRKLLGKPIITREEDQENEECPILDANEETSEEIGSEEVVDAAMEKDDAEEKDEHEAEVMDEQVKSEAITTCGEDTNQSHSLNINTEQTSSHLPVTTETGNDAQEAVPQVPTRDTIREDEEIPTETTMENERSVPLPEGKDKEAIATEEKAENDPTEETPGSNMNHEEPKPVSPILVKQNERCIDSESSTRIKDASAENVSDLPDTHSEKDNETVPEKYGTESSSLEFAASPTLVKDETGSETQTPMEDAYAETVSDTLSGNEGMAEKDSTESATQETPCTDIDQEEPVSPCVVEEREASRLSETSMPRVEASAETVNDMQKDAPSNSAESTTELVDEKQKPLESDGKKDVTSPPEDPASNEVHEGQTDGLASAYCPPLDEVYKRQTGGDTDGDHIISNPVEEEIDSRALDVVCHTKDLENDSEPVEEEDDSTSAKEGASVDAESGKENMETKENEEVSTGLAKNGEDETPLSDESFPVPPLYGSAADDASESQAISTPANGEDVPMESSDMEVQSPPVNKMDESKAKALTNLSETYVFREVPMSFSDEVESDENDAGTKLSHAGDATNNISSNEQEQVTLSRPGVAASCENAVIGSESTKALEDGMAVRVFPAARGMENEERESPTPLGGETLVASALTPAGSQVGYAMSRPSPEDSASESSSTTASEDDLQGVPKATLETSDDSSTSSSEQEGILDGATQVPDRSTASTPPPPLVEGVKSKNHEMLKAFESKRRLEYPGELESMSVEWRSALDIFRAGLRETARAHRVVMGSILANQAYGEALQCIYEDVYIDDEGNTVGNTMVGAWRQNRLSAQRSTKDYTKILVPDEAAWSDSLDTPEERRGGMLTSIIDVQSVLAKEFTDSAQRAQSVKADDVSSFQKKLESQLLELERNGRNILKELETAETRVCDTWDVYVKIFGGALIVPSPATRSPEQEEEPSTPKSASSTPSPKRFGTFSKFSPKRSIENSPDLWLAEMRYRLAVRYQEDLWQRASPEMMELVESVTEKEAERQTKLHEMVLEFLPKQRRLLSGFTTVHTPVLQDLVDRQMDQEVEDDIHQAIKQHSKTVQMKEALHKSSILNRSRRTLKESEITDLESLESPSTSELLFSTKVVKRKVKNYSGNLVWQQALAVVTVDSYLHVFDLSPKSAAASVEEAFDELKPVPIEDVYDWEPEKAASKGLLKKMNPAASVFLPKCTITPDKSNDCELEVVESRVGMFQLALETCLSLKTRSSEERKEWINAKLEPKTVSKANIESHGSKEYVLV